MSLPAPMPPDAPLPDATRPAVDPQARNLHWRSIQYLLQLLFTPWLRYRARGLENLPASSGALLLSNHQSFLDPLLIGLPLQRPVSFLARDSLFRAPIVGWVLRNTYVMPLNREGGAASGIKETLKRMDQGYLVGLFPEGTRSHDGSVGEFKPGFAALLRRSKLPVLPIGIHGAHRALGRRVLSLRPERVCVVFGPPLDRARLDELSQRGREAELIAFVREAVITCQREADEWIGRP
jgi:1-acyl-sn-glycerol-3-phosphate acyltransferase